jgi:hypothetical protein
MFKGADIPLANDASSSIKHYALGVEVIPAAFIC